MIPFIVYYFNLTIVSDYSIQYHHIDFIIALHLQQMVRRTLEQILNKPKRPLNPYFKMRLEML